MATQDEALPMMSVFDTPFETKADELARLLNEQCKLGLYLNAVVPWPGVGARIIMRRYAAPAVKPSPATGRVAPESGFKKDEDGKEAEAVATIKANPGMSAVNLAEVLAAAGIKRSAEWIRRKRLASPTRS